MIKIMHFSSYKFPSIMSSFACSTIQETFGTYRRWHWTSTLLTVIYEIVIYSTLSSAIHTANRCLRPWVRILHSAEEDNLSPFDLNIVCLCQSIEINNNIQEWFVQPGFPLSGPEYLVLTTRPLIRSVWVLWKSDVTSTSTDAAGSGDEGGKSGDGHAGSRGGDAGSLDRGSLVSGGALGLNGCTSGSSRDSTTGMTGETYP